PSTTSCCASSRSSAVRLASQGARSCAAKLVLSSQKNGPAGIRLQGRFALTVRWRVLAVLQRVHEGVEPPPCILLADTIDESLLTFLPLTKGHRQRMVKRASHIVAIIRVY